MRAVRRGARWAVVAVAVTAMGMAGCGDDDDSSDGGGGDSTTTTTEAAGSGSEETAAFCEQATSYRDESEALLEGVLQSEEPGGFEDAKAAVAEFADGVAQLAEEAPEEIRADVEVAAAFYADVDEIVQDAQTQEDLQADERGAEIEARETEVDAATDAIDAWIEESCGPVAKDDSVG